MGSTRSAEAAMLRRILAMLVAGKIFRMLGGHGRHHAYSRSPARGWSHRSRHPFGDLAGLMGLHRRRRSFI